MKPTRLLLASLAIFDLVLGGVAIFFPELYLKLLHPRFAGGPTYWLTRTGACGSSFRLSRGYRRGLPIGARSSSSSSGRFASWMCPPTLSISYRRGISDGSALFPWSVPPSSISSQGRTSSASLGSFSVERIPRKSRSAVAYRAGVREAKRGIFGGRGRCPLLLQRLSHARQWGPSASKGSHSGLRSGGGDATSGAPGATRARSRIAGLEGRRSLDVCHPTGRRPPSTGSVFGRLQEVLSRALGTRSGWLHRARSKTAGRRFSDHRTRPDGRRAIRRSGGDLDVAVSLSLDSPRGLLRTGSACGFSCGASRSLGDDTRSPRLDLGGAGVCSSHRVEEADARARESRRRRCARDTSSAVPGERPLFHRSSHRTHAHSPIRALGRRVRLDRRVRRPMGRPRPVGGLGWHGRSRRNRNSKASLDRPARSRPHPGADSPSHASSLERTCSRSSTQLGGSSQGGGSDQAPTDGFQQRPASFFRATGFSASSVPCGVAPRERTRGILGAAGARPSVSSGTRGAPHLRLDVGSPPKGADPKPSMIDSLEASRPGVGSALTPTGSLPAP